MFLVQLAVVYFVSCLFNLKDFHEQVVHRDPVFHLGKGLAQCFLACDLNWMSLSDWGKHRLWSLAFLHKCGRAGLSLLRCRLAWGRHLLCWRFTHWRGFWGFKLCHRPRWSFVCDCFGGDGSDLFCLRHLFLGIQSNLNRFHGPWLFLILALDSCEYLLDGLAGHHFHKLLNTPDFSFFLGISRSIWVDWSLFRYQLGRSLTNFWLNCLSNRF